MSQLDYQSVRPWARSIREAVLSRKMPPWFADPQYGHFANDARLNAREMETIRAWVDAGAQEGELKDLPKAPEFAEGWSLGKPDIVVDIGENFAVKPGADDYEHFVVPMNLKEGIWIRAAELRPGNRRVVHHAHVNPVMHENQAGPASIQAMNSIDPYLEHDGKLTRIRMDAPVLDDACAPDAPDLPYIHGAQEGALASYLPGRQPDVHRQRRQGGGRRVRRRFGEMDSRRNQTGVYDSLRAGSRGADGSYQRRALSGAGAAGARAAPNGSAELLFPDSGRRRKP